MRRLIIHKCPNCRCWGYFKTDPCCECGAQVFANGQPETLSLDLEEVVRLAMTPAAPANAAKTIPPRPKPSRKNHKGQLVKLTWGSDQQDWVTVYKPQNWWQRLLRLPQVPEVEE